MGVFSEALHPRGAGGKFARGRSDRSATLGNLAAGNRSPSAFQPPVSAVQRRDRKRRIQVGTELARGVRQPKGYRERETLNWASPAKRAEQEKLTGDARMPRQEAVQAARQAAAGSGHKRNTVATRKTFTGRAHRVREVVPPRGAKMTARGRFNLAKYGR